uniref:Kinesin motor domain-containing protein n=1 Tax=Timema cristinae TaxID=61476 RepID=A0A7R9GTZ5_TIMCR|nr:unnamed protein product [Timema cristinae]
MASLVLNDSSQLTSDNQHLELKMVYNKKDLEKAVSPANRRKTAKRRSGNLQQNGVDQAQGTSTMKVIVRVRPPNSKELGNNFREIIQVVDDSMLIFDPKSDEQSFFYQGVKQNRRDIAKKQNKELNFLFDCVFGYESTNYDIYESSTKDIIASVLEGYNCSVFVYGATGAGKTHTMLGSKDNPGISLLTMVELYSQIERLKEEREFELGATYLEVYNENVLDLLQPSSSPLPLRDDGNFGVTVAGLKIQRITSADELFSMLAQGNKNRTQHPTDANAESSRSHAVFQTYIQSRMRVSGEKKLVKLTMIDLAGSERGAATGCKGMRFTEGANINRSLLSLGRAFLSFLAETGCLLSGNPLRWRSWLTRLSCLARLLRTGRSRFESRSGELGAPKKNIVQGYINPHYTKVMEELQKENAMLKAKLKAYEDAFGDAPDRLGPTKKQSPQILVAPETSKVPPVAGPSTSIAQSHVEPPTSESQPLAVSSTPPPQSYASSLTTGPPPAVLSPRELAVSSKNKQEIKMWKERVVDLYRRKSSIHSNILKYEMKLKTLQHKIQLKDLAARRLAFLSINSVDLAKAQSKMEATLDRFSAQEINIISNLNEVWTKLKDLDTEENILTKEGNNFEDGSMCNEFLLNKKLGLKVQDMNLQVDHMKALIINQHHDSEYQNNIIMNLCDTLKTYYLILKGSGRITLAMDANYEQHVKMLAAQKTISFERNSLEDGEAKALHNPSYDVKELTFLSYCSWDKEGLRKSPPKYSIWSKLKQSQDELNKTRVLSTSKKCDADIRSDTTVLLVPASETDGLVSSGAKDFIGKEQINSPLDTTFLFPSPTKKPCPNSNIKCNGLQTRINPPSTVVRHKAVGQRCSPRLKTVSANKENPNMENRIIIPLKRPAVLQKTPIPSRVQGKNMKIVSPRIPLGLSKTANGIPYKSVPAQGLKLSRPKERSNISSAHPYRRNPLVFHTRCLLAISRNVASPITTVATVLLLFAVTSEMAQSVAFVTFLLPTATLKPTSLGALPSEMTGAVAPLQLRIYESRIRMGCEITTFPFVTAPLTSHSQPVPFGHWSTDQIRIITCPE